MPSLGCGTCRARKVRCDQAFPYCNRCVKSGRECKGYGLQLSWPRKNDTRRALVGPTPQQSRRNRIRAEYQLVNTSCLDIELHDLVSSSTKTYGISMQGVVKSVPDAVGSEPLNKLGKSLSLPRGPTLGTNIRLGSLDKELFNYFIHKASYSITAFGHDALRVREILIRISLADTSPSSTAVFKSALALASFHRGNALQTTSRYKVAALQKLAESTQGPIGITESACHVAAGIVLCTLEVHQNSMKSSHWLWYACGATKIVKNAGLDEIKQDEDITALVGWVHYCNTISRFSLRHWQPNVTLDQIKGSDIGFETFHPAVCGHGQPESLSGKPHEILYLLSEVFNTVVESSNPLRNTENYKKQLHTLDFELQVLAERGSHEHTATSKTNPIFDLVVELYRLATLIYLRRASSGILTTDQRFPGWVDQAFALLSQLPACQWPFPLLIFGCEAQTEEQRITILDIMQRTIENGQHRNITTTEQVIKTVWNQSDLVSGDLDYVHKLGVILSSTQRSVPAFI
ncbi:fungal-specific transcription factor domain-containing protein [Fusarium tricinctum]|uniref:Fungal-specific transcription factor domain-containing protein n=1 Tax=Fusarium tricinctum TaxID=61284 RepID=A0A8K0S0E7_9HYPO|nr:fungal-specific transcription factor domain-containing protein [Fusarium tricinctum]